MVLLNQRDQAVRGVIVALCAVVAIFQFPSVFASHGGTTNGVCMVERYNITKPASLTDLGCTSNDVNLSTFTKLSGPAFCALNTTITVSLNAQFISGANERWDVGVFISETGGTPNDLTGTCYSDYLHPASTDNTDLNLTGGLGPYFDGEITEDPLDTCGDIEQGISNFFDTGSFDIVCEDEDDNKNVDVGSCTVWANSRSNGGTKPSCNGESQITAQTTAKCTCEPVEVAGILVADDWGDAPVSYVEADHSIDDNLYLGTLRPVSHDGDSYQGTGTDMSGTASDDAEEDGTSFNPVGPDVTISYLLGVDVFNTTGANATLAGWIDFDCNGTFDASELATVTIDSGSGIYALYWDNGATPFITAAAAAACPTANTTFARLRLGDNATFMSAPTPTGHGGSGEVEDYLVALDVSTTPAVITQFRSEVDGNGNNWLRWTSAAEVGISGFRVERFIETNDAGQGHWSRVHSDAWLPFAQAIQGANYQLLDSNLSEDESASYRIIEHSRRGKPITHGPYTVTARSSSETGFSDEAFAYEFLLDVEGILERQETIKSNKVRLKGKAKSRGRGGKGSIKANTVKLGVFETGVQFLSTSELADAFGFNANKAGNWLKQGRFKLQRNGADVAWFDTGGGLLFYGVAPDNTWSTESMYWLSANQPGQTMVEKDLRYGSVSDSNFVSSLRAEEDNVPILEANHHQTDDYWYWTSIATVAGYDAISLPVQSPGALGEDATLTVGLQGFFEGQHVVDVKLGADVIGSMLINGFERRNQNFAVPAEKLGGAALDVTLHTTGEFGYSSILIDYFDLTYQRNHESVEGELAFSQNATAVVHITGLSDAEELAVLDISSPLVPRWLGGGKFTASAYDAEFDAGDFFAANSSAWNSVSITPVTDEQKIKKPTEYLVIAPEELMEGAQALADYRGGDLKTQVVSLESVYDNTSFGEPDPRSIRNFLLGSSNLPDYVVMVGDGSYDYKDTFGTGYNILSPMLVDGGRFGLVIGDTLVGDMDGDGKIEIPVGRIPAKNNAEVMTFVEKLSLNEANGSLPTLLVADDLDHAGDFTHSSNMMAFETEDEYTTAYVGEIGAAASRSLLLSKMNEGLNFLHYLGHGGIWTLAHEQLLTYLDVPNLVNPVAPKFIALSCNINNFMIPGFDSLGERLLVKTGNGMVVSWSAAGQSMNADATALGLAFQRAQGSHERLGDAILQAFAGAAGLEQVYILLGDPATKLH